MRRRNFLMGGTAALLGTGLLDPRRASSQVFTPSYRTRFASLGHGHPDPWQAGTLGVRPTFRVLEVFLYGGLSPWETFYVNPALQGTPTCTAGCPSSTTAGGLQWGTYRCEFEALLAADTARRAELLMGEDLTRSTKPFLAAEAGFPQGIHLGPATYPLWRPAIFDHMQVLVTAHELTPHEAAVPFSLTGSQLGRPEMAGTGAAVNRNLRSGSAPSRVPAAFAIVPQQVTTTDNVVALTATGLLGTSNRPLLIDVPCDDFDLTLLDRTATPEQDRLIQYYINQYKRRLTYPGATEPVRSGALGDFEGVFSQYGNLDAIRNTVSGFTISDALVAGADLPGCVTPGAPGLRCPNDPTTPSSVRKALNFAAYLLRQPGITYACVVDTGRHPSNGAGYDTHGAHPDSTYRNLTSTLEVLARMLDPALPGEPKLDDDTLVVLTTEFGRGPEREGSSGRQHWPQAYVNVLIPPRGQTFTRPAKRMVGRIGEDARPTVDPTGVSSITVTDLRGALLTALGVDPLADFMFGVGDFSSAMKQTTGQEPTAAQRATEPSPDFDKGHPEENDIRANLVRKVLGYAV